MKPSAEALYRAHAHTLHRYLFRMCGDPELAADVLHDTFERLLTRPPADPSRVRGWLFRVATNRLRDVQRSSARHARALAARGSDSTHADPAPPPDRALDRLAARDRAGALMDALGERDRAILLMRHEGFAHREIAEAVGTTTASVGTMIARALDRVADLALITENAP